MAHDLTKKYFFKEFTSFRKIISSKSYTLQQKDNAYEGLALVYLNVEPQNPVNSKIVINAFVAITIEWQARRLYEIIPVPSIALPKPQ